MQLFDENYQQLTQADIEAAKAQLRDIDNIPVLSEEDMEAELGDYYAEAQNFYNAPAGAAIGGPSAVSLTLIPFGGILDAIRGVICKVLPTEATIDQIIDAVLDAIGDIFWGFFKWLIVRKLVKFLVNMGIGVFCPKPAPAVL
jgi:hypothetical protein